MIGRRNVHLAVAVALGLACNPRMPSEAKLMKPDPGAVAEAKKQPDGWVYRIEGEFGPQDHVPPEAIVGAWEVDGQGHITGEFRPNPHFKRPVGER